MKHIKMLELEDKSLEELTSLLGVSLRNQFKLKLKKSNGEPSQTHLLRILRRNIARIETLLTMKSRSKND